ncbi:hypothetical protein PHSC3_000741 [Chlamydiales bacterium STE3]|nr:hypothetical protein PHSC3_000741 [Chlamydiales bacterium STE3]
MPDNEVSRSRSHSFNIENETLEFTKKNKCVLVAYVITGVATLVFAGLAGASCGGAINAIASGLGAPMAGLLFSFSLLFAGLGTVSWCLNTYFEKRIYQIN